MFAFSLEGRCLTNHVIELFKGLDGGRTGFQTLETFQTVPQARENIVNQCYKNNQTP